MVNNGYGLSQCLFTYRGSQIHVHSQGCSASTGYSRFLFSELFYAVVTIPFLMIQPIRQHIVVLSLSSHVIVFSYVYL